MAIVDPSFHLHRYGSPQARQAALEMAARLRQLPGIDAASVVAYPPLRRSRIGRDGATELYWNVVDPSYFPMVRLPLLAGRLFGTVEPDAIVIGASAARRLWPNQSPLGKRLPIGRTYTVVGVVKDSGVNLMTNPESVEVYTPIEDSDATYSTILVHAAVAPAQMSGALRSAAAIPGIVPVVLTLQDLIDQRLDSVRKMVTTVSSLAATASLLAFLGIFGLLAFTVAQRTREIGVRMALGARNRDVLRIILGQYTLPFGLGTGLALAWPPRLSRWSAALCMVSFRLIC